MLPSQGGPALFAFAFWRTYTPQLRGRCSMRSPAGLCSMRLPPVAVSPVVKRTSRVQKQANDFLCTRQGQDEAMSSRDTAPHPASSCTS